MHMRRIILTIGLLLAAILLLAVAVWFYYDIKFGRQLEAKLAALRAQGMPVTLAEAAPPPVPDDQNAAVLYQKVFGVMSPADQSARRLIGGLMDEEFEALCRYQETPEAQLEKRARELLSRPAPQQELDALRRAAERPYCVFPGDWEGIWGGPFFAYMASFRNAIRVINVRALLSANEGHLDEAIDWWQIALRMSEHAASEPTLIAELVAIAMQSITFDVVKQFLSTAEIAPSTARRFEEYLRQIDLTKSFTDAMIGEQAWGDDAFDYVRTNPQDFYDLGPLPFYGTWPYRPLHKLDELTYLQYMERIIQLTKLPYCKAESRLEQLDADLEKLPIFQGMLSKIFCTVYSRSWQKRDWAVANIALCRVVLALKACKYERGIYPATLVQLQETLDWELPEDPFSGQDFIYEPQAEGFKLYSLGPDLDDDGGTHTSYDDGDIIWECTR